MPSSQKTSYLNLNRWSGTDKPKMDDFNADNQKLDDAFFQLTPVFGSYVGDGMPLRTIELGFRPKVCIVFAGNVPLFRMSASLYSEVEISCAVLSDSGCSMGAALDDNGFTVRFGPGEYDLEAFRLNTIDTTYFYIALR